MKNRLHQGFLPRSELKIFENRFIFEIGSLESELFEISHHAHACVALGGIVGGADDVDSLPSSELMSFVSEYIVQSDPGDEIPDIQSDHFPDDGDVGSSSRHQCDPFPSDIILSVSVELGYMADFPRDMGVEGIDRGIVLGTDHSCQCSFVAPERLDDVKSDGLCEVDARRILSIIIERDMEIVERDPVLLHRLDQMIRNPCESILPSRVPACGMMYKKHSILHLIPDELTDDCIGREDCSVDG